MKLNTINAENFVKKVNELKSKDSLDISAWEDLSVGLMNLVSLEEHSFFSYIKTHDEKFLGVLNAARELRKKLLKLIVKSDGSDDSERWCMSKHLLASSMRLFEVGNRLLGEGKEEDAKKMYEDAAELYGMFWKLNTTGRDESSDVKNKGITISSKEKSGIFDSIKKFLECCKE
ncbi:hypothetical protein J4447_04870 [Candidatus Pacearchaeota archaeon]|nr:hypothetical protein [Candidatus Pacearchaeota archaeon]